MDDYCLIEKEDGYYISEYNGFEEEEMIIPNIIDGNIIIGIARGAFHGLQSVKKIRISEGIEVIENVAFSNCSWLEEILLPNSLRVIGSELEEDEEGAFEDTGLTSIIIPDNVTYIGPHTFMLCHDLEEVILSNKMKVVTERMFSECENLSRVELPLNLEIIEENAFEMCWNLNEVYIPMGTKKIEFGAFSEAYLTSIYIPPSVENISIPANANWIEDPTMGCNQSNLTIYCTENSEAMRYARRNKIKWKRLMF